MRTKSVTSLLAAGFVAAALAGGPAPLGAAPAQTPPVAATELPGLGGSSTIALDVDTSGRAVGASATAGGSMHPVLWDGGRATDLAPTLPARASGEAQGIADNGRIVGFLTDAAPGGGGPGVVTWLGGTTATVSAPPATGDEAVDVNNRNEIVYRDSGRSFLWRNGSRMPAPDVAPGVPLRLADVNEQGLTAGTSAPADPDDRRAYTWLPGRAPVRLGTLGGSWSEAVAVNDQGQVVGLSETAAGQRRMFVTQGSSLIDLGTLGGDGADAVDAVRPPGLAPRLVNNHGHVVGVSETAAGERHAFLWRDGRMTDLGTLGPGGTSQAHAVNDLDQVVGLSSGGAAAIADGFVWQDGRMVDLGQTTGVANRLASAAFVVDNRSQAVGQTVPTPGAGPTRAWLWTAPLP
jgi:probable HAF family extracellular repeat protein